MESLGPGELKHGITQTFFVISFFFSPCLISDDKGASSELSGITAVRPHYGRQASDRYGETQAWNHPNSTKWGNSCMESLGPGELKHGITQTFFFITFFSLN